MTTPRELPELPPSLDEVSVFMGARSDEFSRFAAPNDEYFSAADMHAYARQAIAESEARAEGVRKALRGALVLLQIPESDIDSVIDAAIAQEAGREGLA